MTSKIVVNNIEPDAGISTVSILGIATATKFIGDIEGGVTGNVTGNVTGSSGSCTGNAATATVASGITTTASVNTSGIVTATAFIPTTGQLSHRNKVINGAMNVAQRNMPITSANGYCLDMFKLWDGMDSGVATVDQSTHSPDGFSKSFKVDVTTADTSLAATDYARIHHRIEAQNLQDLAYGTSEAKNIVISFYVRSTTTGTYVFSIEQSDNSNKHCVFNYTVNSANTWERKTFSIAGDTAGVINDDNGYGFTMYWILAAGSNYSSGSTRSTWTAKVTADSMAGQSVNLFSNTSNEFFLTGVQLEVGTVVTPFEHRSFSDELSRCQRYYQQYVNPCCTGVIPDNGSKAYSIGLQFQKRMRAVPTLSITNAGTGGNVSDGQSTQFISTLNAADRNLDGASIYLNLAGDLGDFRPACLGLNDSTTNSTTYKFTAEL